MPSRKNRNATRQSARPPANYSPALLPIDSPSPTSSWSPEQSPLVLELDEPPDPTIQIQLDLPPVVALEDEISPIKHEGGLLLATPESRPSPVRSDVIKLPPIEDNFTSQQVTLGHTRSPVLAREPTMLETFSRTVRNYVPTSIPVPASAPSPPRVSKPVSFGSFMAPPGPSSLSPPGPKIPIVSPTARKPLGTGIDGNRSTWRMRTGGQLDSADVNEPAIFGSEDEDSETTFSDQPLTTYPTAAEGDSIMWSRWDTLIENGSRPRRILILGYTNGLQIWDCTILGSVSEILNLTDYPFGSIAFAGVLATPHSSRERDSDSSGSLIGVVSRSKDQSTMSIYSLRAHKVIKHLPFHNVSTFASSVHFIVISTTNPPTLHILSSASFTELHTISSLAIIHSYTQSSIPYKANTNNTVSLSAIDSINTNNASHDHPVPIFALSHRILAYASPPPRADSHAGAVSQPRTHLRSPSSTLGISHATALKVGGTVLSGVKSLGGMAYSAAAEYAKSRAGAGGDQSRVAQGQSSVMSGVSNLFFSRSAPAATSGHADTSEVTSPSAALFPNTQDRQEEADSSTLSPGHHITVLDLASLLARDNPSVRTISEFIAFKHQPFSALKFTPDGNSLLVSPRDGQVVRTFQIRPTPSVLLPVDSKKYSGERETALVGRQSNAEPSSPWHMYNLRRGRTSAIIDEIEVSPDGRWVAVGTKRPTVHVFAINPYGGKPDLRSHMENRVRNTNEAQPLSVELSSLVRLRSVKLSAHSGVWPGITFTFLPSDTPLPTSLQPPPSAITSSPSTSSSRSDLPSPLRTRKTANFQDLLLFDPSDGVLSLRRVMLEQRPRDAGTFSYSLANLPTSMSLPGTGTTGRLSSSPQNRGITSTKTSGLTQMMLEAASELHGRDTMIATWQLRRHRDWSEVKHVQHLSARSPGRTHNANVSSLAHAELSTCSRSPSLVPRCIYLAHQFSFCTLGEDYHALIRRHQLDMTGTKIEVRKEVEVSAYSAGTGESFVEGFSPRDMGRTASSFDEPIASAISADMDYPRSSRSVIPMLPNGAPGLKPRSFKNPIPIRAMTSNITEGVGESFGRIRREINRVRSPQLVSRPESRVSASVPLEFDEHDEDVVFPGMEPDDDVVDDCTSRGGDATDPSIDTPPTDDEPCDEGTELWHGWTEEDKLAVDEAEQFDDVVGFLDEEQTPAIQAEQRRANRQQLW
ncbi:uncharacterized protein EDB91DRAFT_1149677 [Suillus paluster]|uniref:uncharacterized protein n=1 Tax=Suillus paluster TaxID=48578 RepID=UPI001B87E1D4|nr:uncharacterized protein EDB91DRAFT_1149677 [Suillus paluster]KAG1733244.1 hypothetical protein EDB91DRAFT_1149677 [Suillus paluster]